MKTGPISASPHWSRISGQIAEMSKKNRPWEFGLLLLHHSKSGSYNDFQSPRLTHLVERLRILYDHHASNLQAWVDVEMAIRGCDYHAQVTSPVDSDIIWSEHSAFNMLQNLADAGRYAVLGNTQDWCHAITQAALADAHYQACIAVAHTPLAPVPASPRNDVRLKETAAEDVSLAARDKAGAEAAEQVFQRLDSGFALIVERLKDNKRRAAQREEAFILSRPWWQRWVHRFNHWRHSSTGIYA
jgi:hypothetical protein